MAKIGWPRFWHVLLLLPLVGAVAWVWVRAGALREPPGEVLRALRAAVGPALPTAGAAGAVARTEPQAYDRETLYEYINGAAESYLGHGFERCLATTYTFKEAGGEWEVAGEVYRFGTPAGALAQLAQERPSSATPVPALAGAFADPSTLLAVRNRDYLKLTAMATGEKAAGAMRRIAAAWLGEQP